MSRSSSWLKAAPLLLLPLAPVLAVWLLAGVGDEPGEDPEADDRVHGIGAPEPGRRPGEPELGSGNGTSPRGAAGGTHPEATPGPRAASESSLSLWGRVTANGSRSAPDATVTVRSYSFRTGRPSAASRPLGRTNSERDGSFRFSELPSEPLVVEATASGFAPAWIPLAGPGVEVLLELQPGGTLRVRVLGAEGDAVADGRVVYVRRGYVREETTDAEGWVEMPDLPPGPARIRAYDAAGRFVDAVTSVPEGAEASLECVVGTGWELAGRVVDAASGSPLAGVEVEALDILTDEVLAPVGRTGEDGRFLIASLSDSSSGVVLRTGQAGRAEQRVRVSRPEGAHRVDDVELRLAAARWTTGRVIDEVGSEAAGAEVWWASSPVARTAADGSGAFRISVPHTPDPDARLVLAARSEAGGLGVLVIRRTETASGDVVVRLSGTGAVRGRVVDERGEARQGASVTLEPARVPGIGAAPQTAEETWARGQAFASLAPGALRATTEAEGAFHHPGIPAGTYRLRASHAGSEVVWPEPVAVWGADETWVEVVLPTSEPIAGWVVGANGDGVSGAAIAAWSLSDAGASRSLSGVSRRAGRFELPGASGDECWEVVARLPGHAPGRVACARAGDRAVEVVLGASGALTGHVREVGGGPYTGPLRVRLAPRTPPGAAGGTDAVASIGSTGGWREVEVRAGSFTLRPVAPARYLMLGEAGAGSTVLRPVPVEVPESGEPVPLDLSLIGPLRLEGRIVREADAAAVTTARVVLDLVLPDGSRALAVASTRTDTSGRYSLPRLAPGTYLLRVQAPAARPYESRVEVRGEGPSVTQDVSLPSLD